jgi:hypothetical protein
MSPQQQEWLRGEIDQLLQDDLIEPSHCEYASPVILVNKPEPGSYRCCIDYRKVNKMIEGDSFPMTRPDDLFDKIGQSQFLTKLDLSKGFYQVPIDVKSRPITTFCTPFGTFRWKRLPFGLKISPACFNTMLSQVLTGAEHCCGLYVDDVVIFSNTWADHLCHIRLVFDKLKSAGLTVKLSKCSFACQQIDYLGYVVGVGQVRPKEEKVKALMEAERPAGKRQLQSFLGAVGYYRRFIPHFSELTAPLTSLLCKGVRFEWTAAVERSFQRIKQALGSSPVLTIADFTKPFFIFVDASLNAIGAILMQKDNDGLFHPVSFYSKKLNSAQRNYSATDREGLALILAVRAFRVYLCSKTVVFSDHEALKYIHCNAVKNQRLLRWSLELQMYDLVVEHVKGKDNCLADFLSRTVADVQDSGSGPGRALEVTGDGPLEIRQGATMCSRENTGPQDGH